MHGQRQRPDRAPGKVCLYLANLAQRARSTVTGLGNTIANTNGSRGFEVALTASGAPTSLNLEGVWAYTAP